jgi:hypothetical protein
MRNRFKCACVKPLAIAPTTLAGCDRMASIIRLAMEMRDHAAARIHDPSSHGSAEEAKLINQVLRCKF